MKAFRIIAIVGALATLTAAIGPAGAATTGTATGGGFYRTASEDQSGKGKSKPKPTKTKVTITAVDDTETDSGRALVAEHKPGKKPTQKLNLTLDCVVVDGQTAYASGTDRAGARHYLTVEDNGEPGKSRDKFGTAGDSLERTLYLSLGMNCGASDIATSAIHGGNFQVRAAE